MTLEQVFEAFQAAERDGNAPFASHTGDPSIYGAIREQMDLLRAADIPFDVTPGVSSFCGAAAAIPAEYTLPGISQTVILTRMAGRTPVPQGQGIAEACPARRGHGDFSVRRNAAQNCRKNC